MTLEKDASFSVCSFFHGCHHTSSHAGFAGTNNPWEERDIARNTDYIFYEKKAPETE